MKKEVSCINSRAIIDYVRVHNNGELGDFLINLDPEIDACPDPEIYLTDQNNWISCRVAAELYKRARILFNDELTAFYIARYAAENFQLGYTQSIMLRAFWTIKTGLKNLQRINDKFNRNKKVELCKIEKNSAVVRLHYLPGMEATKDICLYNQGAYMFLPLIWGDNPIRLEETCCYFEGAPFCEYHLKWERRNSIRKYFSRFFTTRAVLNEMLKEIEKDKRIIEQKFDEVNRLNMDFNRKIRQFQAIHETGKAILSVLNLEKLLNVIMNTLSNICRIQRALILTVDEGGKNLEYLYATGFEGDIPENFVEYKLSMSDLDNILVKVAAEGRAEYITDTKKSGVFNNDIVLSFSRSSSVYIVPLTTRSRVIGIIATDSMEIDGIPLETREILEVFSPQIAISIENARLYKRLQEQMLELKRSNVLLSRAEKLAFLGDLAARLAHEIKNPMTAIGTFLQMLPYRLNDEEFLGNFHKVALEETERVNNLISELLDLANTRELRFEHYSLHKIIDKMILLVSPGSNVKRINVIKKYDSSIHKIWIDTEKIKQVILNLLSNAVEFTRENGKIEITTSRVLQSNNCRSFRIEISDNGEGISKPNIDKIFDPYFTTKHKSKDHQGTGLGLFIAHQNVLDHGGTIEVKSRKGFGTTFTIDLPVQPDKAGDPGVKKE